MEDLVVKVGAHRDRSFADDVVIRAEDGGDRQSTIAISKGYLDEGYDTTDGDGGVRVAGLD